jgi:DNA-binding transcriptional LysR family regulator
MDLPALRCFVVLAGEMHYGRTAQRLGVSTSAVSQQIRALERQSGAVLIERSGTGLRLTAEAQDLLPVARRVLEGLDAISLGGRSRRAGLDGRLRVGIFGNGIAELTLTLFRSFASAHPGVDLQIFELNCAEQETDLLAGRVDVALVRLPISSPRLTVVGLFAEPRVLWAPSESALAGRSSVSVSDLEGLPFVEVGAEAAVTFREFWRLAGQVSPGGTPTMCRTLSEILMAVALGRGVTSGAMSAGRTHPMDGISHVSLNGVSPSVSGIAVPKSRSLASARRLVDMALSLVDQQLSAVPHAVPVRA